MQNNVAWLLILNTIKNSSTWFFKFICKLSFKISIRFGSSVFIQIVDLKIAKNLQLTFIYPILLISWINNQIVSNCKINMS